MRVVIDKLLLNGAVEALAVGVHLRGLGVGMIVDQMKPFEFCLEVFHKLTAVVGQDKRDGKRKDDEAHIKELFRGQRGMRGSTPRKTKPREDILERDDITSLALNVLLDRIQGHTVARILGLEIVRFSDDISACDDFDFSEVRNFLWMHPQATKVLDKTADGLRPGTDDPAFFAETREKWMEFLFAKIGMRETLAFDFLNDVFMPEPFPLRLGCS